MMRKQSLFFLLSLFCLGIQAQRTDVVATMADGTAVEGTAVDFKKNTYEFFVYPSLDMACVKFRDRSGNKLRNDGSIQILRMSDGKRIWKKDYDFDVNQTRMVEAGILMFSSEEYTLLLDIEKGKQVWKKRYYPVYIDEPNQQLLCYQDIEDDDVVCIDLRTGKKRWDTDVDHDVCWGWDDVTRTGNYLYVMADDLYRLQLDNGDTKRYKAKTATRDFTKSVLKSVGSIAKHALLLSVTTALTRGLYHYKSDIHIFTSSDVTTSLASNILHHNGLHFIADRNNVACIDADFRPKWETDLPARKASHSQLFERNGSIWMLNDGYGMKENKGKVKSGKPFLASFDASTGQQQSFMYLTTKKDIIEDSYITSDGVFLVFDDGTAFQQLTDSVVNIREWNVSRKEELVSILKEPRYVISNGSFQPVMATEELCPVLNEKDDVFVINRQNEVVAQYDVANLFREYARYGNALVIGNGERFYIIGQDGRMISQLTAKVRDVKIEGGVLYILTSDGMQHVDMSALGVKL